jgi:hypothetical protein
VTRAGSRRLTDRPSVVRELEAAQSRLWEVDRRRYVAQDAVWQLIKGGRYAEHEYLTAKLELAHVHMVARDVAEGAVMAAFEMPRPPKVDAERTRALLRWLLHEYGCHSATFESTVRQVHDRHEERGRVELARQRRRVGARLPAAPAQSAVTAHHVQPARTPAVRR